MGCSSLPVWGEAGEEIEEEPGLWLRKVVI